MKLDVELIRNLDEFVLEISFSVESGIHVLFGRSGVGKTQTLECIAGLVKPDKGWIQLGDQVLFSSGKGRDSVDLKPRDRRVGYVFQDGMLFPHKTLKENVLYPLKKQRNSDEKRAAELLEEMGLEHLADRYPHEVSGGQKRRASLARALASEPSLLLLDEPFVHLDRVVRSKLIHDLEEIVGNRKMVALLVTHDFQVAASLADTISVVEKGKIVQFGPRNEVLFRPASGGVARLLGDVNMLDGTVLHEEGGVWRVDTQGRTWRVPFVGSLNSGRRVEIVIRTGAVKILKPEVDISSSLRLNVREARVVTVNRSPDLYRVAFAVPEEHTGGHSGLPGKEVTQNDEEMADTPPMPDARVEKEFEDQPEDLILIAQIPSDTFERSGLGSGDACRISVSIDGISLFPTQH